MKKVTILIMSAFVLIVGLTLSAFTKRGDKHPAQITGDKGFAVVELFTSEGCSSCPSADAVIAKLEKEIMDKPVYILAYHVDYWNRLGWKDVFSSADFSRRQNNYADWLNLSSVYTPQVIINGKKEFVGSEEGTLRKTIGMELNQSAKAELSLSDVKVNANMATVSYHTDATAGSTLVLALVRKAATTVVKGGENGGRTLSHVQIVNNIQVIPLSGGSNKTDIRLGADFSPKNFEVIAFVQNSKTGEIAAASRIGFQDTGMVSKSL